MTSVELRRNDETPAGPEQARGLGDPAVRIDPDRRSVLRDHEVEAPGRQPGVGGIRLDERELDAGLAHHPAGRLELRRRDVDADGARAELREPRREVGRAAAELDDVEAGDVAEHVQLGLGDPPDAPADLVERPVVRGAVVRVLAVGLGPERAVLRRVVRPAHRGTTARSRARPTPGESEPCTRLFGIASAYSPRSEPGVGLGGVRRADRAAARRDRALALEHERERRARGDEVDELAEERLLAVLGVVRLAELAARDEQPRGAQLQTAALEARDDLAGEIARDGVGLGEDESALDGHRAEDASWSRAASRAPAAAVAWPRPPSSTRRARPASRSTGTPARAARAARLQVVQACRSFVVHTGQTRKSSSTSARQTGQRRSRPPRRLSIALISSSRSRTSSRYSGGRKSM